MKVLALAAACALIAFAPSAASAGVYTDEMTKCLVRSSTAEDNTTLAKWIFAVMSTNATVKPLTVATAAQREQYSRAVVGIMERLLTNDCRSETVMALKVDGTSAIGQSFKILGELAVRNLMSDKDTIAEFQKFSSYADKAKWQSLMQEAGQISASPSN